ncbi:MAG TPA: gas vesicle protein K [Jatrophihabitans sp.]|jgi:signal transduction histidine kinase
MTDEPRRGLPIRIETDTDTVARDLLRLVLTLVELIRQLMERQAIRRLDELDDDQAEALGNGLMRLKEAIDELREAHGIRPEDLDIDLGPFGTLLAT